MTTYMPPMLNGMDELLFLELKLTRLYDSSQQSIGVKGYTVF